MLAVSNTPLAFMSAVGVADANIQGFSFRGQGFGKELPRIEHRHISKYTYIPRNLRTHILRLLGPKTIL